MALLKHHSPHRLEDHVATGYAFPSTAQKLPANVVCLVPHVLGDVNFIRLAETIYKKKYFRRRDLAALVATPKLHAERLAVLELQDEKTPSNGLKSSQQPGGQRR